MIIYYSGRSRPYDIEQIAAPLPIAVMISYGVVIDFNDQRERVKRIVRQRRSKVKV